MEWYLKVLKNYVNFSGRARRKEYWMFELFNISIMLILYILDLLVSPIFKSLYLLYSLAVFLPTLGVIVRRLHDIGNSGLWILINFVPFIGSIWLLVLTCTEGTMGPNSYGPDPKGSEW